MMGKQNIPIRGHVPEESNFHATLSLTAQQNSILQNHLEQAGPTAKYPSPEIQNELLDIAASQILNAVVPDCKRAQCYAFIADESTYIGVKEEISLCAHFVDKKEDGPPVWRVDILPSGCKPPVFTIVLPPFLLKVTENLEMGKINNYCIFRRIYL